MVLYKYGLYSPIGIGSPYKTTLYIDEPTSSIIMYSIISGFETCPAVIFAKYSCRLKSASDFPFPHSAFLKTPQLRFFDIKVSRRLSFSRSPMI